MVESTESAAFQTSADGIGSYSANSTIFPLFDNLIRITLGKGRPVTRLAEIFCVVHGCAVQWGDHRELWI